jgi:hypothetical protein
MRLMAYGRPTSAAPSAVTTRPEFAESLEQMLADYRANGRDEWENTTLGSFPDALGGFAGARITGDAGDQEAPSWRLFAEMMVAATAYE